MTIQSSGIENLLKSVSEHGLDGALGALVVAIIASVLAWHFANHGARWSRTMDFHREFNTEIGKSRTEAFRFVKKNWGISFVAITERDDLDLSSMPLFDVMHFYQRLWVVIRHRQISKKPTVDLFGEIFVWWFVVVFRQQLLSSNWQAAGDILALYCWFERATSKATWTQWNARHESEYQQLRQRYSIQPPLGPPPNPPQNTQGPPP